MSYISFIIISIIGICLWHFYELNGFYTNWYKDFIESYIIVDLCVYIYTIIVLLAAIYYVENIKKISSIVIHTIIIIEIIISLNYIPAFLPIKLLHTNIYYHVWISILLTLLITCEIYAFAYHYYIEDTEVKCNHANTKLIHDSWKSYASSIVTHIENMEKPIESYSIAIASPWGSGKTTMLNEIKKQLEDRQKYIIREFTPWKMTSSNQINKEFFILLQDIISESPSIYSLNKILIEYANLLSNIPNVPTIVKSLVSILGNKNQSIIALHTRIDDSLQKLNRKIVIIIDDLDRLEHQELFEMMRLIRVSANFRNILFFVAYDKQYIIQTLQNHGISRADEYIKKIINLEISLPIYEEYFLGNLLYKTIIEADKWTESNQKDLFESIQYVSTIDQRPLVQHYFLNFRDVERFSRSFVLLLRHISKDENKLNISWGDFFWLEVLHYFDNKTYNTLRDNVWEILELSLHSDVLQCKQTDNAIIAHLFPQKTKVNSNSIARINNFTLFFAFATLENSIALEDFREVMQKCDSREKLLNKVHLWLGGRKYRDFIYALKHYYYGNISDLREAVNYIDALLFTALFSPYNSNLEKDLLMQFRVLLNPRIGNQEYLDKKSIIAEFEYIISNFNPSSIINRFLATMTTSIDMNGDDEDTPIKLLSNQELKKLAKKHFEKFKQSLELPNITTLFNSKNQLYIFVKSSAYVESYYSEDDTGQSTKYTSLLSNAIEEVYANQRFSEEEFKNMMDSLMKQLEVSEDTFEVISIIEKLFGSCSAFINFIDKHFTLSSQTRESYMRQLNLNNK